MQCCICSDVHARVFANGHPVKTIECPRCGQYSLFFLAEAITPIPQIANRLHMLSSVCRREWTLFNRHYPVSNDLLENPDAFESKIASQVPESVTEKATELLRVLRRLSTHPGEHVRFDPDDCYPLLYCATADECRSYLNHMAGMGYIQKSTRPQDAQHWMLTVKGWEKLETLNSASLSNQCFVAMWFDKALESAYMDAIKPLEIATGWKMLRVDQETFEGKICDKIISELRQSRFAIVDVTGHRSAVYFEAGFAMGRGIPVIWCCYKDDENISKIGENFDTRQYRHILWATPDDLKAQLIDAIGAIVGMATIHP